MMKPEPLLLPAGNLYYARLNAFDELRKRQFALVGQVGSTNEVDIGLWCVRGCR